MGRRGSPYHNAKAESFRKTLKAEAVCPMAYETFEEATEHLPLLFEEACNTRKLHSVLGCLSPEQSEGLYPANWKNNDLITFRPWARSNTRRRDCGRQLRFAG
ncbi:integrase core domain-containing protein [Pararhizobium sp.]|uniref:integrase core domain-containing protein n=1 Tax=Pararhizobium sp. TaxID=1977563 RepID=UPI003D0A0F94